jgi:hypothetical protein
VSSAEWQAQHTAAPIEPVVAQCDRESGSDPRGGGLPAWHCTAPGRAVYELIAPGAAVSPTVARRRAQDSRRRWPRSEDARAAARARHGG